MENQDCANDRSVSLKLPQITPHSLGRCLGSDHSSRHLPPDAIKYFLAAIPSALEELQSLLRKHEGEEMPSVSWLDGYAASKNKQDHLKPRLPNFLAQLVSVGAEPRPKGPHLEMGATCQVHGLREARSRCHCGCLNSIWDAIGSSILGNTRNEQGHSCIQCAKCQSVLEPTLTLCKRLPRAPIDRSHSELSISTTGDSSMQIHLLNLKVCVERIRSRSLEELTEQQLLEEDPEVYWCLHIFYGLRAEIFWRMNANAPFVLASTGFNSLCRSYAAAKKQEHDALSLILPGRVNQHAGIRDFISIFSFNSAIQYARGVAPMVSKRPADRRVAMKTMKAATKSASTKKGKKDAGAYNKPVSAKAWAADKLARQKGRVQIFNSTRPHGMDGWTMDLKQYNCMRAHILQCIKKKADQDGSVALQYVVNSANERYKSHPLFPKGRLTNYVRYTKVDLEARGELQRSSGSGSQRISLMRH
eukprot:s630_g6.t1